MNRLRRAAAMTFLIYVVLTLLATVPTLPTVWGIGSTEAPSTPGGAVMLEVLEQATPIIGAGTAAAWVLALVVWVLSPFLQMAWLAGLHRTRSVGESLAFGASHYLRAVLVTAWMLLPLAVVGFVLTAPPLLGHLALSSHPNARVHDVVVLALLVPGTFLLVVWCIWHDLARAALAAGHERPRDAVRATWHRLGVRSLRAYVGWTGLAALLALAGHALAAALDQGSASWRGPVLLVLLQVIALARVACRGAWLGTALDRVEARGGGAPPECFGGE